MNQEDVKADITALLNEYHAIRDDDLLASELLRLCSRVAEDERLSHGIAE